MQIVRLQSANLKKSRVFFWSGIALLVLIGVASSMNRGAGVTRGALLFDPLRPTLPPSIVKQLDQYDGTFVNNRRFTLIHIVSGSIFLIAAPLQFSAYIRKHYVEIHRWSGRCMILLAATSAISGLWLAIPFMFTGIAGTSAVTLFGVFLFIAVIRGFVAIRRGDVQRHRDWMIRAFSIGIGISVVRIVGGIVLLITRRPTFELLGLAFWLGWLISVLAGEVSIRRTRAVEFYADRKI